MSITTRLRLHPEFLKAPRPFARHNGVDLVSDVFLQTDFRQNPSGPDDDEQHVDDPDDIEQNPDDPGGDKRIEKSKSNIHLVRHGAIRLFAKPDGDGWLVHSIDLNPSILIHRKERARLRAGDMPLSLNMLKGAITPLLAEPLDALHIVPGLVATGQPVAFWSLVDGEFYIPQVDIRCLHGLSHPDTGPAEGAKQNRIQLGDEEDDCLIRFKKAKWNIDGPDGERQVEGIRVRLVLKGRKLNNAFMKFGTISKVDRNTRYLVAFTESGIHQMAHEVMARLEGTCLPVPAAWLENKIKKRKDRVTHAKAITLVSQLTSIPLEELRVMDEELRHPSDSTRKRLNKDVPVEADRLTPVPVASLFDPSTHASQTSGGHHTRANIDPLIANAYIGA
jgi:hypothetical protein